MWKAWHRMIRLTRNTNRKRALVIPVSFPGFGPLHLFLRRAKRWLRNGIWVSKHRSECLDRLGPAFRSPTASQFGGQVYCATGPSLQLTNPFRRRVAARECRRSLRPRNQETGELTQADNAPIRCNRTNDRFSGAHVLDCGRTHADTGPVQGICRFQKSSISGTSPNLTRKLGIPTSPLFGSSLIM